MNADRLIRWVRDWLNSRVSHHDISVHLRSSAAKIPFFLITHPQPDATRQGPGPSHPHPTTPGSTAPFKPSGIDPLNREPAAELAPRAGRATSTKPQIHIFAYQPSSPQAGRAARANPQIHIFAYQPSDPAPANKARR